MSVGGIPRSLHGIAVAPSLTRPPFDYQQSVISQTTIPVRDMIDSFAMPRQEIDEREADRNF
jgi:hypothetical protein